MNRYDLETMNADELGRTLASARNTRDAFMPGSEAPIYVDALKTIGLILAIQNERRMAHNKARAFGPTR